MNTPASNPKTLRELSEAYLPTLNSFGIDAGSADTLNRIFQNWLLGTDQVPAVNLVYRNIERKAKIEWMLARNLVNQDHGQFVFTFPAYAALLVHRKRAATRLRPAIDAVLKTAAKFLDDDPSRSNVPLAEFFSAACDAAPVEDLTRAMALLSTAGVGLHRGGGAAPEEALACFSLEVLAYPNTFAATAQYMRTYFSTRAAWPTLQFSAFSLESLALSEETYRNADKALERLAGHPDAAITSARAALEAAFRWIAHQDGKKIDSDANFYRMLEECKAALGLELPQADGLARAVITLCNRVGELRNVFGDAHGKSPAAAKASRSEARLIAGASVLLSAYLLERWEAKHTP
jgi:hypothetical protein